MMNNIFERVQQQREQLLTWGVEHFQTLQSRREVLKQRREQVVEQGRETVHKLEVVVLSQAHELVSRASDVLGDRAPILKQGEEKLARLVEQLQPDADALASTTSIDLEVIEPTDATPTEAAPVQAAPTDAASPVEAVTTEAVEVAPAVEAAPALPIEGYDALTIKKLEPLLAALDEAALHAVRAYELANKNRVTVLRLLDERLAAPAELL